MFFSSVFSFLPSIHHHLPLRNLLFFLYAHSLTSSFLSFIFLHLLCFFTVFFPTALILFFLFAHIFLPLLIFLQASFLISSLLFLISLLVADFSFPTQSFFSLLSLFRLDFLHHLLPLRNIFFFLCSVSYFFASVFNIFLLLTSSFLHNLFYPLFFVLVFLHLLRLRNLVLFLYSHSPVYLLLSSIFFFLFLVSLFINNLSLAPFSFPFYFLSLSPSSS